MQKNSVNIKNIKLQNKDNVFPPVVSVLGHVDHGKTSLLDAIRKTNIASREKGGITQKIGASEVEIEHEGETRKITFIDTPGHEAFDNMRARGVLVSDLVLLLVASDDGVMPQTKESIKKVTEAKVPFIVVITKVDLPNINIEKVKQQINKEGVLLEGLGGDVPYIGVSSKTGEKIKDLLDLIVLVYDINQVKKDENADFLGLVIESKLDRKKGAVATVIVKNGKIQTADKVFSLENKEVGKVRALIDAFGKNIPVATPGKAVEILGIRDILPTGSVLYNTQQKEIMPKVSNAILPVQQSTADLVKLLFKDDESTLRIVLKTQTKGEVEAIKNSLPEKRVEVVFEGQGDVSISDVLLAKDFGAIIVGFNNEITREAKSLAESEHIFYKIYSIIYELLDEVKEAVEALLRGEQEEILGKANILASFDSQEGKILGLRVIEGRLALSDKVKVTRGKKEIGRSKLVSLRRGKQEVKEAGRNIECGAMIAPFIDFLIGDVISSYK
ncbi:MAG: hypothetical protein A2905_04265 [Candidatus Levybacteria bacterium RIFCSPLOWO2_01_FULL_36_10]|nr:MAG: hypothetical protein A2905_04265 [Candidatus Levybacteria bacterium RIFCSPLOWO2_01_FULL_36_10]